ncbi:interleukin 17 receptor D [Mus musculus]|nr:interleukin 17 receptor D [Mus musculus]
MRASSLWLVLLGSEAGNLSSGSLGFIYLFLVFRDRVSLCSPGCPGTHSVDQAGLLTQKSTCPCLPSAGIKETSLSFRSGVFVPFTAK